MAGQMSIHPLGVMYKFGIYSYYINTALSIPIYLVSMISQVERNIYMYSKQKFSFAFLRD